MAGVSKSGLNGWAKKNIAVILQIFVLIIGLVVMGTMLRADVGHLKSDQAACDVKNREQDECITNIEHSLGVIEGKLDIIIVEVYND